MDDKPDLFELMKRELDRIIERSIDPEPIIYVWSKTELAMFKRWGLTPPTPYVVREDRIPDGR